MNFPKYLPWLLLLIPLFGSSWSLLHPGLAASHDLHHQARIFEMAQGLRDGSFPVIWSENLGYGYGMPLFEFYAPLPYLVGAVFYLSGLNLTQSVEAVSLLTNILAIISCYLLADKIFKNRWSAVLAATAFSLAPYRAVDLTIRAAISESWAIAWLPVVLLGIVLVVTNKKYGWIVMSVGFASLITSHNLTALMAVPFLGIFGLASVLLQPTSGKKKLLQLIKLTLVSSLGLGLATFYLLPAVVEKNFTQIDDYTLSSYYDFRQHFLYIRQFLKPWGDWEYGGSMWGPDDEMSFFLGYGQLVVIGMAVIQLGWLIIKFIKTPQIKTLSPVVLNQVLLAGLVGTSLFLTLLKVQPLWELFKFTAYFQFPWRFLAITTIFLGLLAGSTYLLLPPKYRFFYFLGIFVLIMGVNPRYFQSERYDDHTQLYDDYATYIKFTTSSNLFDYLPKQINFFERRLFHIYKKPIYEYLPVPATSIFNDEFVTNYQPQLLASNSVSKKFQVNLNQDTPVTLYMAYYPGWTVTNHDQTLVVTPNENGLISFVLPAGDNQVRIELKDTPVRYWSKIVSLISASLLFTTFFHQAISKSPTQSARHRGNLRGKGGLRRSR